MLYVTLLLMRYLAEIKLDVSTADAPGRWPISPPGQCAQAQAYFGGLYPSLWGGEEAP
jgi:hypothetical protein